MNLPINDLFSITLLAEILISLFLEHKIVADAQKIQ